ncbi:hypothetical protein Ae406Ps2_2636 [Pseudonocardia sp. Ae406_Ps2]|nr:hypothetical protein Ae331Ps2_3284c [Pseudonocardia sp. Ae331_Ps2]OLM02636.1 hypothetical protein Ae406Ps2_2636 [Pseudonocardia sp. Ae406_Ps2]OLM12520.1 hypothetical protein Ae505Ps2_2648c [Pseudonocardia sp. Ae505_Ps2]OLM24211.1 hypothetical protein Ae706Ps2_2644 [Pseudonocardia sp. Ae706_Ps2]
MVNEIIVAFLGTLHLDQRSESKPFTPWSGPAGPAVHLHSARTYPDGRTA